MKEPSFKACDSRGDSVMRRYIAVIALGSLTLCAPLTTAVAQDAALDAKIASMENENAMLKKRLRLQALEKENAALKKQLGIADNSQSRSDERPSIVREQRVASNGPVTIDSRAAASRPEIPDVLAYAKGRPYSKEGAVIDPPLPVLTDDWSGVYVGAEAGYGWGRQRFNDTFDAGARAFDTGTTSSGSLGNCSVLCETVSSNSRVFLPNLTVPLATANQKGWLAGGFFGAQKQWGSFALGLEADIDGANINGAVSTARTSTQTLDAAIVSTFAVPSATACPNCNNLTISPYPGGAPNATVTQTGRIDSKTDELGTLRGRVGFAPARELLMYGTGGLAWAHTATTLTGTQTVTGTVVAAVSASAPPPGQAFAQVLGTVPFSTTSSFSAESKQTLLGWSAGGGMDWKLMPNVILGALYLHYEFPPHTLAFGSSTLAAANLANTRLSVDVVKARASYLLPIH